MPALESELAALPLLPVVIAELLSLDPDADDYFDRLLRLAEGSAPLAERVLGWANSVSSTSAKPIVSLYQAHTRLGSERISELILALAVIQVFVPRSPAQRALMVHSLETALFARLLSRHVEGIRCNSDQAYLCGLLHDIGRFVQFQRMPADLTGVDDLHRGSQQELIAAERRSTGYDHALLGWQACKKWMLPNAIGEVVRRHHDVLEPHCDGSQDLIKVVQWADQLSVAFTEHGELAIARPGDLLHRIRIECGDIGPPDIPGREQSWVRWLPDRLADSMQLSRQLHLTRSEWRPFTG
jgi:putative nucleotidyltransferase with HDIG domain